MAKAKKKSATLGKPGKKGYTKSQLIAHLAAATSAKDLGDVSKKQVVALLEELGSIMFTYAPVGAVLPGLGKLILRQIPARPARQGRNPATGEAITIAAKPKRQKLVFRFSKDAKTRFAK
jgi:DNA-binding protein HU-beta